MTENILSEHDYNQILIRRFNEPKIKFVKSEIGPWSKNVEGFLGDHYKLEISYELNGDKANEHFFVKTTPNRTKTQSEIVMENNFYKKEIFFYDELIKGFENFGYDTSFVPKCYYCIPGKTLVMEDASRKNFRISNRQIFFDLSQCKAVLKALALFHGAGLAYEQNKSKDLGRCLYLEPEYQNVMEEPIYDHYISSKKEKNTRAIKWINSFKCVFIGLVDLLPDDKSFKDELKKRLQEMEIGQSFAIDTKNKKTFGHGDLWSNNILFRCENGLAKECRLIDFQLLRYHYPIFDVLLVLYTNTNRVFRKHHLQYLLQFYYDSLTEILQNYDLNIVEIYKESDFRESLELVQLDAMFPSFNTHLLAYLPDEIFNDPNKVNELLFCNKREIIQTAFNNDPVFREIITQDLYELNETVGKKL